MVNSLAWPVIILIAIIIFRAPIANLISNIEWIRHKDTLIGFRKRTVELVEMTNQAIPHIRAVPSSKAEVEAFSGIIEGICDAEVDRINKLFDKLYFTANISPKAAIIMGWTEIEFILRDLAQRKNIELSPQISIIQLIKRLLDLEFITKDIYTILRESRALRNYVSHGKEFQLAYESAENYLLALHKIALYLCEID